MNLSRPKIIARIFGGIGNQLFCYAAARRLAVITNAEMIIDDVSGFVRDYKYQRCYQLDHFNIPCRKATSAERMEPFSRIRRFSKRYCNQFKRFEERSYISQEGIQFDSRLLNVKPPGVLYLEGYWPSEQYFKDIEAIIRTDLEIKPPKDKPNLAMAARIGDCLAVAVHVRFFDPPGGRGVNNAPNEYYKRAVTEMEASAPGAHYFVFSDQPNYARTCIPLPEDRITCVTHNLGDANAYADLWLMTKAQHFITANSTFSWWGAWLACGANKIVFAPGKASSDMLENWDFNGLIPPSWNQC